MKDWIVSVAVIVILTTILTLILPDGKSGKSVRCIFAFVTLYVFVTPLLKLKNQDVEVDFLGNSDQVIVQTEYLDSVFQKRNDLYEEYLKDSLKEKGVINAEVDIDFIYNENFEYLPKKININLEKAVIKPTLSHIDIIEITKEMFYRLFSNKIEFDVVIYE